MRDFLAENKIQLQKLHEKMKKLREEIDERELKKAAFLKGKQMKVPSASYMKGANFANRPSPLRKSVV